MVLSTPFESVWRLLLRRPLTLTPAPLTRVEKSGILSFLKAVTWCQVTSMTASPERFL